jgi:hypothetical protein
MDDNKEPVNVNGLIIVLAVYINDDENNFNELFYENNEPR